MEPIIEIDGYSHIKCSPVACLLASGKESINSIQEKMTKIISQNNRLHAMYQTLSQIWVQTVLAKCSKCGNYCILLTYDHFLLFFNLKKQDVRMFYMPIIEFIELSAMIFQGDTLVIGGITL